MLPCNGLIQRGFLRQTAPLVRARRLLLGEHYIELTMDGCAVHGACPARAGVR